MRYRPRQEEYNGFMNEFSGELSRHFPDVCFGCFGSTINGDAVYGKADIDGFLIMDSGIVSDKKTVKGLSQILARALTHNRVKTQFNLIDRRTLVDGRFLSYTKDYTNWLKNTARVVCGPDYVSDMRGYDPKFSVLHSAAFNFCGPHSVRNAALYSLDYLQQDYEDFEERVQDAIDRVAKFPKKLIWFRTGRIVPGRRESQRILERNLQGVDYSRLDEINGVLDDVRELDRRLGNPEEALRLLYNGLEVMEQMILAYVVKYPPVGRREARE